MIAQNPLAYEYDALYDDMKSEREVRREVKKPELKSRYIDHMVMHAERREREQIAAWEKMEKIERVREVETG